MFQQFIVRGNAGRYHFCNAAFHNPFAMFRIFQLVADRYPVTGLYQFMQISIKCMMRKTCKFMEAAAPLFLLVRVIPSTCDAMMASSPNVS